MSNNSKTVNIVTGIVVPAFTALATVFLLFFFKPEETTFLFWFNLFYTVFLESVFFVWIGYIQLNETSTSNVFKIASGITALYYIFVGVGLMLVYGLGLRHIESLSPKYYYAVILIITLLWFVVGSILLKTDSGFTERTQEKKTNAISVGQLLAQIKVLCSRFTEIQSMHGFTGTNAVDELLTKFMGLTPRIGENESSMSKLQDIISNLDELIDEAENASAEQYAEASGRVKLFAKKALGKVEQIKVLNNG